jgi:hypothetical protein
MDETAVIDHAIKTLSQGGEIKVDIPARVSRVYGRQLSIAGSDGSRSSVAIFYFKGRLYQIEGIALPDAKDAGSYVIRFQQSLVFTGGETNRSGDVEREPRRACRGGPEGAPGAVASNVGRPRAEERCRRGAREGGGRG